MTKYFILFYMFISVLRCNANNMTSPDNVDDYLMEYFGTGNYEVLSQKLPIDNHLLNVAVRYIDKNDKVFDKAVGYVLIDGNVVELIHITADKIFDDDKNIIFDALEYPYDPYGWKLFISIPKDQSKYKNGFAMVMVSDKGKRITDGPNIIWDETKKKFIKFIFDSSLYD